MKPLLCSLLVLFLGGCATKDIDSGAPTVPGATVTPGLKVVGVSSDDTDTGIAPKTMLWGKEYIGLRGRAPYFVAIPNSQKILFVTPVNPQAGSTVVHVADFETKTVVDVPAFKATDVGSNIGTEGEGLEPEKVLSATDHAIILQDTYTGGIRRYTIDLDAKTVTGDWIRATPKN